MLTGCQMLGGHTAPPQRQNEAGALLAEGSAPGRTGSLDRLEAKSLAQAEKSVKQGEISKALLSVAQAISLRQGQVSARALGIIRAILARPEYNLDNHDSAGNCLRQLESSFPHSKYDPTASCWLTGLSELTDKKAKIQELRNVLRSQNVTIQTLRRQIEQLKAVDLELVQPDTAVEVP